jgi:hypothetical protein
MRQKLTIVGGGEPSAKSVAQEEEAFERLDVGAGGNHVLADGEEWSCEKYGSSVIILQWVNLIQSLEQFNTAMRNY